MSFFNFLIIVGPQPLEGDVLLKDAQGSCFATDLSLSILKQIDKNYISLLVITHTIEKGNMILHARDWSEVPFVQRFNLFSYFTFSME